MRIRGLDLRLRLKSEHGAVKQRPAQKFPSTYDVGEMIDLAQMALWAKRRDRDKIVAPDRCARADEIDKTCLDAGDRGHSCFARSDFADITLALERARPLERLVDRIDTKRERADRRSVQQRKRVGEALAFTVDNKVDFALRVQIDILRPVSASATEAKALDQCNQLARRSVAYREFDEFSLCNRRRRR